MNEVDETYGTHNGKRYPFPATYEKQEQWVIDNVHTMTKAEIKELIRVYENLSIHEETYAKVIGILKSELNEAV